MSRLPYKWRTILPVMLSLLIGITILVSVVGISFSNAMYSNSKAESQDIALRYVSQVKIGISSVLSAARGMSEMLAEEVAADTATRAEWVATLKAVLGENPYIQGIYLYFEPNSFDGLDAQHRNLDYHDATGVFSPYVTTGSGVFTVSNISLTEHQKNGYYQAVQQTGSEYFSNPVEKNGKQIATAVVPVKVNNRFIGFVAAEMNFSYVENLLLSEKLDMFPNAFIQVIASDGIYVAHTRRDYVGKNTFDVGAKEATQTFREVLSTKQMITTDVFSAVAGETCSYITAPITILNNAQPWLVSVVIPRSDSDAPVLRTILSSLLVVGVVVCATLIMLFISSNVSVKRLTEMNDHLYNTTRSGLAASAQIADTGESLAQGSVEQAASIEETSAMANQTATMLRENTEGTAKVALLANEAVEAANDGLTRVEDLLTSMRELEISSEEIAKIIAIIDNIAFQTSILALNASVEAARVGEAGKGFTVVAEEVRNLATRSTEAAGNTSVIVGRNLQLSRQGVVSSTEVSQALQEISAKSNEVNDLVTQISAASQEQLTGINHIHIALAQMEDVTQSNAAVAEENSAAASELKEQAYKLSGIQTDLSDAVLGTGKARSAG